YEGPPTANGNPGIHHVLARVFKDIIPRYKVMKGYHAPRIAGWDTHGLPVELEVEKELGFSGKTQIEQYGIAKFNERCRASVFRYLKQWNAMTERIGYWVDQEHPYITMDNSYIESVWWALKQMWDKGLIYQGYRVTPHCPRCGTSLSSHEVALGYQEGTEDPSVFIKFKIDLASLKGSAVRDRLRQLFTQSGKPAYLLAWTTTPWTLPGNTATAVAADAEYAVVELENEHLVFAAARLMPTGLEANKVVERVKGSDLVNVEYEPLFNPHRFGIERLRFNRSGGTLTPQPADDNLRYHVISTDFVSMEDGTGIVHIAPAYGEVDYQAGEANLLDFVHTVDLQGKITGTYSFAGKFVKKADPLVLENLQSRNLLFRAEKISHTYPFCWRCNTPLLYYAKQSWYIKTTAVKERLISGNEAINWYPEHIKYGRFGDWLQNNVDWAFSRERYWGTPLPVWKCESCGGYECIGSVAELKNKSGISGFKEPLDLHRPFVDEISFKCGKCGGRMVRQPEVIDCWFDSGAMPFAQSHYPFENDAMLKDGRFPADFICEAVDQTRGWFYSLHAISTLLFDKPCYQNVICLGHILDAKGEKMSKTRGNVVEPCKVISKYGADALRWCFYTSSPPGNVRRFSEEMVGDSSRVLSTLWNVYSFFVTYANIDNFKPAAERPAMIEAELDRWILSELNQLVADVDSGLEHYDPTGAGRKIEEFIDYLSNWYVRRSRRRFWKSESDTDKLSAYNTLYDCLVTLAKLMAPFTPFLAEELYQNLVAPVFSAAPESVHLADFPVADISRIDKELAEATRLAMKVSSLGRAARAQAGIKVRQPLPRLLIKVTSGSQQRNLEHLAAQVVEEVNVKALEAVTELPAGNLPTATEGELTVMLDNTLTPELAAEGMAREIVHRLQTMRRSAGFEIADNIITYYQGDDYIKSVMTGKEMADYIRQETLSRELVESAPPEGAYTESFKLSGHEVTLGVKKLE
ncbi:MAG: isoleucine--tRNA ligase, partial [Dehalococcoidales bacterium]|nr:isoleucine--tRNA ligase [Dehalococcoidales bacterium]